MPSYDDDLPTQQEEILIKQLEEATDIQQRFNHIVDVKSYLLVLFIIDDQLFYLLFYCFDSVKKSLGWIQTNKERFLSDISNRINLQPIQRIFIDQQSRNSYTNKRLYFIVQ